ncbi:hypothetical protein SeLEV6574_g07977, partial [Synchytrium endobioticum]
IPPNTFRVVLNCTASLDTKIVEDADEPSFLYKVRYSACSLEQIVACEKGIVLDQTALPAIFERPSKI